MKPSEFLELEVYPLLTAGQVYTHPAHKWKVQSTDKWKGSCPWHESKTGESFVVTTKSLLWWCGGCHEGGDPARYLWRLKGNRGTPTGKDYPALAEDLARMVGKSLPKKETTAEDDERNKRAQERRSVLSLVEDFTQAALWSPAGREALEYLHSLPKRGYKDEEVRALGFGFYPSVAEVEKALRTAGADMDAAKTAGVLESWLEGRVTVPWADESRQPLNIYGVAFGAGAEKTKAKKRGLSNPKQEDQEDLKTKRSPLYLDRVLTAGHKEVVLVEGVFDAALLQVRGDTRAAAYVAASLSADQIETLVRRGVQRVFLCGDPDAEGDRGTASNLRRLMKAGVETFVVPRLPDGKDADELVNELGIGAWKALVDKSVHAFRHQAADLIRKHKPADGWTDVSKVALLDEAFALDEATPPERTPALNTLFWPAIQEETGLTLEAVMDKREAVQAYRVREAERLAAEGEKKRYEDLLLEVGGALQARDLRKAKDLLRAGVDRLRVEERLVSAEPALSLADELAALEERLSHFRGEDFLGLRQVTLGSLDKNTLGLRGLMLLAGPPNKGKTALAVQLGVDVVDHNPDACFLFVALDMPRWDIYTRIKSRLARMDFETLVRGDRALRHGRGQEAYFNREQVEALRRADERLADLGRRIRVLDERNCPAPTVDKVLSHLRDLKAKTGTTRAFLLVDYLQVWPVQEDRAFRSDLEADRLRVGDMKTLRDASDETAVLAISEARKPKGGETWAGGLADVMGSARGTYTPDMVFLLRPLEDKELEGQHEDELARNGLAPTRLSIVKGRDGVTRGDQDLTFHYRESRFSEGRPPAHEGEEED